MRRREGGDKKREPRDGRDCGCDPDNEGLFYAARASATDWIFAWKVIEILVTYTPREESFSVRCDWLKLIESRVRSAKRVAKLFNEFQLARARDTSG